ncbi:MAG: hypothetical protein ACJASQ_001624 [Crocinitomicaceae bacterium]|jgi:hypothetical protein
MIQIENGKLVITVYTTEPKTYIEKVREALVDITACVIESDETIKTEETKWALAVLIRFQEHLTD